MNVSEIILKLFNNCPITVFINTQNNSNECGLYSPVYIIYIVFDFTTKLFHTFHIISLKRFCYYILSNIHRFISHVLRNDSTKILV